MRRRTFLAASAASLALPAIAQAQKQRVLKFIPQSDLAVVDPIWTTAYVTRNHAYMVFDTLYGQTGYKSGFKITPQMVAGHVIEDGGKTWKLTLRDGLLFHNNEMVLARDCAASIKRWGARDAFGSTRRTSRRRRRSASPFRPRRSRACETIRSDWDNCRRHSARISPVCPRASRFSGVCTPSGRLGVGA